MSCVKFGIIFGFILLCHPGHADKRGKVEIPPEIFPTDKSNYKIIPKNESLLHITKTTAPLHFPEKGSNYTIINNSSILESLKSHTNKSEDGSEVPDLLKVVHAELVPGLPIGNKTHETKQNASVVHNVDFDAEDIQDEDKTEDVRLNMSHTSIHMNHDHSMRGGVPLLEGQTAAIVASAFLVTAILVYVGLMMWRRYLEQRYGTREMLINEDYNSYNDMKNFEL